MTAVRQTLGRAENPERHLITLEGKTCAFMLDLFERASRFEQALAQGEVPKLLQGRVIATLFFESSTRTRTSFQLAARHLGAEVVDFDVAASAVVKGESLLDTVKTLRAMGVELVVIRHSSSGTPHFIASSLGETVRIVNAGDGRHAHPTQALLDLWTLSRHIDDWHSLKVAIVGDLLHSRVARSLLVGLKIMGVQEIRLIGPRTLLPPLLAEAFGAKADTSLTALEGVDAVFLLRLQRERMSSDDLPSAREYARFFGLTKTWLQKIKPGTFILHPGPVNRGIEIASDLVESPTSLIWQQVTSGIAMRMAVLQKLFE